MAIKAMTPTTLAKKIVSKSPLFILDVRTKKDFADWKVEGEQFEYLNLPYFDLLDGVEGMIDQLPEDKEMLVVCAKEGSSVMVAEMLSEQGVEVFYLEGGMQAWSEHLEPVKVGNLQDGGEIYQFVRFGKGCLTYMVLSNGEAAIIDATRMTDVLIDFATSKGAVVTEVMDTHLHADHISGGRTIAKETGARYWLPAKDAEGVTFAYEPLEHGATITVGETTMTIQAFASPGHTIGSMSFIVDETYLLSGDTLFIDSIGRPDLAGFAEDWADDLRETLYTQYKQFAPDLVVLPAHFMGMEEVNENGTVAKTLSTLFTENHGLTIHNEKDFKRLVTENLPPQPKSHQAIRETNMGKNNPDIAEQQEMEIGPNRCAIRS